MLDLSILYQEMILDHWRHPMHFGELSSASHKAEGINPICGDEIRFFLQIQNNTIEAVQFTGQGCAISIASASLLTELLIDKTIPEAYQLFTAFHQMVTTGEMNKEQAQCLGKTQVFSNIKNYPMRVKCAILAWHTLKAALEQKATPVTTENDQQ